MKTDPSNSLNLPGNEDEGDESNLERAERSQGTGGVQGLLP